MSAQEENMNEQDKELEPEVKEAIAKIKQPPSINETLMEEDPQYLINNPAVAPQMQSLNDPGGTDMIDNIYKQDLSEEDK
ncbi:MULTISPECIES: hypothetical protein [Cyanophyceae]|jgi:hypothetical protein|uniref:hypothetical protein n=1 Tax=Cyanophyceae TaxID=3028117 RepID=UPI001688BB02|nr:MULTISPECIES: hypothetical protein [unclassified Trichocoleus]MBD1834207.1 hypothetical protein [Cyanobacteria bacterium FACHB-472]MBD1931113.1 hypothetical protein [Trichocoleus sp. FACHB-69]MBD2004288.1 hypothetical protein [Trichocoleus sp. FACHB-40]